MRMGEPRIGMLLFAKPVAHPIKRFDHVEGVFDLLKFSAQPLDVAVYRTIIDINLIIVSNIHQSVAAFDHAGTCGQALLITKIMSRSVKSATATFDLDWNEWVVVIECAGAPTLIERKRRQGLRENTKVRHE
jgi:hypothetical protein